MPFRRLVILMCAFLGLTLLGMHSVPAILPLFAEIWSLNYTEAGWLTGINYLTYLLGVAFVGITDRIDARRLLILGALLNVIGYGGMGLADGFWSALAYRAVQGLGFAWTYMPGIKAMGDRIPGNEKGRAAAIYVSSFAIGSGLSVWLAAEITVAYGWQWAFVIPAISNAFAAALLFWYLPPVSLETAAQPRKLLPDFRPVFRNRASVGYVIGSFAHNFELQGIRSWTVTFLAWAAVAHPDIPIDFNAALAAMVLILIGVPSSFVGAGFGHRIGYARTSFLAMAISAVFAVTVGYSAAWPIWAFAGLVIGHNLLVLVDSGTLNGGAVNTSDPAHRGNTVAAFGTASAAGGLLGPVLLGVILDATGGGQTAESWGWAFALLGITVLVGGIAVRVLAEPRETGN
ncbi:MAG: MFS transporter [Alphaproteobacteria bacterium]|nr:MFS transporter [Alphaproteobacteria bacterium]